MAVVIEERVGKPSAWLLTAAPIAVAVTVIVTVMQLVVRLEFPKRPGLCRD